MVDCPIKTFIYRGFSIAMLNNQMVCCTSSVPHGRLNSPCPDVQKGSESHGETAGDTQLKQLLDTTPKSMSEAIINKTPSLLSSFTVFFSNNYIYITIIIHHHWPS
jgi:hypothetical protein